MRVVGWIRSESKNSSHSLDISWSVDLAAPETLARPLWVRYGIPFTRTPISIPATTRSTSIGPEYAAPAQLAERRRRSTARKTALALREFALGVEALERFTAHAPLRQVHQAVFGVLALESEPVDPRL